MSTQVNTSGNFDMLQMMQTMSGSSASYSGMNGSSFINSIYALVGDNNTNDNGNDNGNGNTTSNLILQIVTQTVPMLANMVMGYVSEKAADDVSTSSTSIIDNGNEATQISNETEEKINEILSNISSDVESIESAITEIEKLGGDDGLEGINKQLEEEKKTIEGAIKELKELGNGNLSNDEKINKENSLLVIINSCCENIACLLENVNNIKSSIDEQQSIVDVSNECIEEQNSEAVNIIAEGLSKIQGINVKETAEGTKNIFYTSQGATETTTGATLQAAAAEMTVGTLGYGAVAAEQISKQGTEYTNAGTTHIQGSSANLKTLAVEIGKLGSDFTSMQGCLNAIGDALDGAANIIGSFNTKADGMITAIGSYEAIGTANKELVAAVNEYNKSLDEDTSDSDATAPDPNKLLSFNTERLSLEQKK